MQRYGFLTNYTPFPTIICPFNTNFLPIRRFLANFAAQSAHEGQHNRPHQHKGIYKNNSTVTRILLPLLLLAAALQAAAQIKSFTATRHEITARYDAHPNARAIALLAPYTPAVDSVMAPVLGQCNGGMSVSRPESPLSNWLSDVLRDASEKTFGAKAHVALYNMGGIRSVMPDGKITQGDIYEIAPFENYLTLLTLRGTDLLELCRNISAVKGEGISGLSIIATPDGQLIDAKVNGAPIAPDSTYNVVTLNYLAEGNDRMHALKQAIARQDTKIPVRDILMDAVRQATAQGRSISANVEGRYTVAANAAIPPHQSPAQRTQRTPSTLRILHTNDTHSQIKPYNPNATNRDMADKGGAVRRATFIDEQRRATPGLLLLDAGDFSQGSLYYNIYKGDVEIALMNLMGYDACTIGNHEFDFGLDNMARIFRQAQFPVVNCNYDFSDTVLRDIVKPYVVITRDGVRIGITGVGCPLEGLVTKENCPGVTYTDPTTALPPVIGTLRNAEHCDLVICLSHCGADPDIEIIQATSGIDLVIGGHSHTYMELPRWEKNLDGVLTPSYQMGKTARFIGDVRFGL